MLDEGSIVEILSGEAGRGQLKPQDISSNNIIKRFKVSPLGANAILNCLGDKGILAQLCEHEASIDPLDSFSFGEDSTIVVGFVQNHSASRIHPDSFLGRLYEGIQKIYEPLGGVIQLLPIESGDIQSWGSDLKALSGLVMAEHSLTDADAEWLFENRIPSVFIGDPSRSHTLPAVDMDNHKAAYIALQYLAENGWKHPLIIEGRNKYWHTEERLQGFRDAAREYNLDIEIMQIADYGVKHNESRLDEILPIHENYDSIVSVLQPLGAKLFNNLASRGVKLNHDKGVVNFGSPDAFGVDPIKSPIPHVINDFVKLAEIAAHLLQANLKLKYENKSFLHVCKRIVPFIEVT